MPVELDREVWRGKLEDQEVFKLIQELYDSPAELKNLVRFAHHYIQIYRSITDYVLPDDYEAEDVVATVIEKNLDGTRGRGFDPAKGTFTAWLKRQIESEIKNKARWERSALEVSFPLDEHGDYHDEQLHRLAEGDKITPDFQPDNPEQIVISEEDAEARWDFIYEIVDGDSDLVKIVEALEGGCDMKPRNLATELGWSLDRVNKAKKRFKRRLPASNN